MIRPGQGLASVRLRERENRSGEKEPSGRETTSAVAGEGGQGRGPGTWGRRSETVGRHIPDPPGKDSWAPRFLTASRPEAATASRHRQTPIRIPSGALTEPLSWHHNRSG